MSESPATTDDATPHPIPAALLHDLRTPLNHILGYSDLLMEQAAAAGHDDLVPYLERIRTAGHQLLTLINDNFQSAQPADTPAAAEPGYPRAGARRSVHGTGTEQG